MRDQYGIGLPYLSYAEVKIISVIVISNLYRTGS